MPDEPLNMPHGEYLARRFQDICYAIAQQLDPNLAQELQGIVRSMLATGHGFDLQSQLPYAHHRIATDAAVQHLQTTPPWTLTREQLVNAILAGGWALEEARRGLKAKIAIGYSITRTKRIVERDGKLALPEQS